MVVRARLSNLIRFVTSVSHKRPNGQAAGVSRSMQATCTLFGGRHPGLDGVTGVPCAWLVGTGPMPGKNLHARLQIFI
jgi:hypothetical protein